jgi:hypothetical protein
MPVVIERTFGWRHKSELPAPGDGPGETELMDVSRRDQSLTAIHILDAELRVSRIASGGGRQLPDQRKTETFPGGSNCH